MTLSLGQTAPNASGKLPDGSTFTVEGARGRALVLFFYPRDFTPGCTREVCSFRDAFAELSDAARVVGVSRDDGESHKRFSEKYKLPYDLVSDLDGSMAAAFDVQRLGLSFLPQKRVTYVIDAAGVIRGVFHHELVVETHVADVRKCIQSLRPAAAT